VHVAVLAECDGLADDWSGLSNMRALQLDNIYPSASGFSLGPLGPGQMARLQLGFEAQHSLTGRWQRLELKGLGQLVHVKVTAPRQNAIGDLSLMACPLSSVMMYMLPKPACRTVRFVADFVAAVLAVRREPNLQQRQNLQLHDQHYCS